MRLLFLATFIIIIIPLIHTWLFCTLETCTLVAERLQFRASWHEEEVQRGSWLHTVSLPPIKQETFMYEVYLSAWDYQGSVIIESSFPV